MNTEVQRMWVRALTSGEYKQGFNKLRVENNGTQEYCCLGVLADLYIQKTGEGSWKKNGLGISTLIIGEYGDSCELLSEVLDWAGLSCSDQSPLVKMNDHDEKPFTLIARHIEENL